MVLINHEKVQELIIDDENKDVLQLVDLKAYAKKGLTNVQLQFQGDGRFLYQMMSSYFLNWKDSMIASEKSESGIHLDLNYDRVELKTNDIVTAQIHAHYSGEGVINYAMIDLGIPPGFQIFTEDIDAAVEKNLIEKYEIT